MIGKSPIAIKGSVGAPALLSGGAPFPFDLLVTSGSTTATVKGAVGDIVRMQGLAANVSAKGKSLAELSELAGFPPAAARPLWLCRRGRGHTRRL
jgi:hypothetical protein